MWCFVANGEIELSASADDGALHLYVMATDQEFVLQTRRRSVGLAGAAPARGALGPTDQPEWQGADEGAFRLELSGPNPRLDAGTSLNR